MNETEPDLVRVHTDGEATVIVTLDRPQKRNALSMQLMRQLLGAIRSAADDKRHRVLVLRAEGPVFCAGLDLKEAADPANADASAHLLADVFGAICDSPLVTVACVHGPTMGGGAGFVAACDFVLAGDDFSLGFPEVRRGLVAALVTALMRRHLPDRVVRQTVILGQTLDARRCMELGLLSAIVPVTRLDEEIRQLTRDVCAGAPNAVVRSKRLLDELAARPVAEDLEIALRYHVESRHDAEHAEGVRAFLEKRPPDWGTRH